MKNIIKSLFILYILTTLSGCAFIWFSAGATIGIGGYKYIEGQLKVRYSIPYEKVVKASENSLKELQIKIIEEYKDLIDAKIIGKKADGTKVQIKIKNRGPNNTWLSIRVGFLGDREESMIIKRKIDKNIGVKGTEP